MLEDYFSSSSFLSKYYFANTFIDTFDLLKGYKNKTQLIINLMNKTLKSKVIIYLDPQKQFFSSNNNFLNRILLKYNLSKYKPDKIKKIISLTCEEDQVIDIVKVKMFGISGNLFIIRNKNIQINTELLNFYLFNLKYVENDFDELQNVLGAYSINQIHKNTSTLLVNDELLNILGYNQDDFNNFANGDIIKMVNQDDLQSCQRIMNDVSLNKYYFIIRMYAYNDKIKYVLTECTRLTRNIDSFFVKYIDVSTFIDSIIPPSNYNNLFVKNNYFNHLLILNENDNFSIEYADKSLFELLGVDFEFLMQKGKYSFLKCLRKKSLNSFINMINESVTTNKSKYLEIEVKSKEGGYYSFIVMTLPSFVKGKHILSFIKSDDEKLYNNFDEHNISAKLLLNDKITIIEGPKELHNVFKNNFSFFDWIHPSDLIQANKGLERMKKGLPFSLDFRVLSNDEYSWCKVEAGFIQHFGSGSIYNILFKKSRNSESSLLEDNKFEDNDLDTYNFEYDIINDMYDGKLFYLDKIGEVGNGLVDNYLVKLLKVYNYSFDKVYRWVDFITGKKVKNFTDELIINGNRVIINITGSLIYKDNLPVKVVGTFTDVTSKYSDNTSFIKKSHIDYLTRVYNKTYGEFLVRTYLNTSTGENYLILVDINNFYLINKEYGYMFGNIVLSEFAFLLKSFINNTDILYRLENDDFIILLTNRTINDVIEFKNRLNENLKKLFIDHCNDINISCTFAYLKINNTDDYGEALNKIIELNKQYFKEQKNNIEANKTLEVNQYNFIDNLNNNGHDDIIYLALDLLEKSHNIFNAINILLCRIGKRFNLSSIHILKYDYIDRSSNLIYYWNALDNDSIFPSKIKLSNVSIDIINSMYDVNGMANLNYNDFKKLNEIIDNQDNLDNKIFFSSANFDNDTIMGNIVFEPLIPNYIIPREQKYILNAVSKIIFIHLKRAELDNAIKDKIEFIAKVGHEIRSPLNGVIGLCNIAKNYINDSTRLKNYLDKVDVSGKYLLSLVNSLLDLNKVESGKLEIYSEQVNLDEFFKSLESLVKIQSELKNIKLVFNCNYSCKQVLLDPVRMNQILINLLGNALKFTPEGGMVILDVHEVKSDDKEIYLKLSIQDNGIGISKENLYNIFLPFQQASPSIFKKYGGTGLGLSISSNLVKLMGGILEVESEIGKGTRFFFTIKLLRSEKFKIDAEINTIDYFSKQLFKKRVLVVDDNDLNREIVEALLMNVGAITEQAKDAEEAIEMYSCSPNNYYDYILMDYCMPGMNGLDATNKIRTTNRDDALKIPIIAITANLSDNCEENLYKGFNGFVPKPLDEIKLYNELIKFI